MPTTTFTPNDPTNVALIGRWTSDGTRLVAQAQGSEFRFSFTGTDLQINHTAGSTSAIDVSIDGGSYTGVTTTNNGPTGNALITLATGLSDASHTASVRINNSSAGGSFKVRIADGISVTGAAPAIAAFTNHDTTGRQHLIYTDYRIIHNHADFRSDFVAGFTSPSMPRTSNASHPGAQFRFKTDGAVVWVFTHTGGLRCYVDGFANEEKIYAVPAGTSTPTNGWHSFALPNDSQMHEVVIAGTRTIDQAMVQGGTGIFLSSQAPGLREYRIAFVGDSVMSGDSASGYANASCSLDILTQFALDGRFITYNRGLSGDTITAWNSNGRARVDLLPIQPDIVVFFMGVNDISGLTNDTLRDQKRDEYIVGYTEVMKACPKAKLYQFQISPDHSATQLTQYNRLVTAQTDAIASVAASYPTRTVQFVAADAGWTYGPGSPTTGYTRAGAHPYPSGYCYGLGKNHASIVLSANPSGGDSITATVAGTSYTFTFNAGAHGGSPNPVTVGGSVGTTITNLKDVMLSVLGRKNLVAWTNGASEGHFVGVRNCTAISKSGTNVFVYRLSVPGFADMVDSIAPGTPVTGLSFVIGG